MRAAVQAAEGSGLTLLGVTVLTSMDDADLKEAGYALTARELVKKFLVRDPAQRLGSPWRGAAPRERWPWARGARPKADAERLLPPDMSAS